MIKIYELGKKVPLSFSSETTDKKLLLAQFEYSSKEIYNTSILLFAATIFLSIAGTFFDSFLGIGILFVGGLITFITFIYPTKIFYVRELGNYNEEMIRAIFRISTYIHMGSSLEYAFVQTADSLRGTLQKQFQNISKELKTKKKLSLGDAIKDYVDLWNSINPSFLKSLRLLQITSISNPKERDSIIKETLETLMMNYNSHGKRFTEELAEKTKKMIALTVLFPIMSLILLPLISIFLPDFGRIPVLIFIYNIFFPSAALIMTLNFSAKRIQVDTIRLEDSAEYKPINKYVYILAFGVLLLFAIPTIAHLGNIDLSLDASKEYSIQSVFLSWLLSAGLAISVFIIAKLSIRKYQKLWNRIYEIERDVPHLLQSFSTYLGLNISVENVIPEVIDDYEKFGFPNHPMAELLRKIMHRLKTSKSNIMNVVNKTLYSLNPSRKVSEIFSQMLSFSTISQKSAAKSAKLMREQSISLFKLDEYLKTILSETVSMVNITSSLLAPLLCATAIIMSLAIVQSLVFISDQLTSIASLGSAQSISLNLVDITQVIPPTVLEVIVGVYLIEIILILSVFVTNIQVGNDKYQVFKNIANNISGFLIYSIILFIGFIFMNKFIFEGILS